MSDGNMEPVATDGELILYADKERKMGKLYNEAMDTWTDEQPLQVFFKWGNFEPIEPVREPTE